MPTAELVRPAARSDAPILGLASAEAARRLAEHGPNELPHIRRQPLVLRFARQFTDLFAVVLEVASAVTLAAFLVPPHDPGNLQLSIAIAGVVVVNACIGFLQEYSAERTAEALRALVPEVARVIRDGGLMEVPARELVPGDVVLLEAGDAISADCRVLDAAGLTVDMAALTGESRPVPRMVAVPDGARGMEQPDLVFMGTPTAGATSPVCCWAASPTAWPGASTARSCSSTRVTSRGSRPSGACSSPSTTPGTRWGPWPRPPGWRASTERRSWSSTRSTTRQWTATATGPPSTPRSRCSAARPSAWRLRAGRWTRVCSPVPGSVAARLAAAAERWNADLIVVGSRRPSDLDGLILGSVGHELVRRTFRPVLLAEHHPDGDPRLQGPSALRERRSRAQMSDSKWMTDLRRPCTPSRGRASPVLAHPFQ